MCGGDFMSKNPEEAMDFLSYVAEVSRGWDEPHRGEVGKMKSQPNALHAKAGMYTLNEDDDMKAKFAAMTRRVEELELKKMNEVQCPSIPVAREMYGEQANVIGQFKSNSILRMAILITQVGGIIQIFHGSQEHLNTNSRLNHLNHPNKLQISSQPHQNPKGIHEVETHEGESSQVRDVKSLITLRSGKKVESTTPKPYAEEKEEEEIKKREEMKGKKKYISEEKENRDSTVNENLEKELIKEELMKKRTFPHFPQALHGKKGIKNASEILEVLSQVKVNIPLLDMIKQVPTYANAIIQCKSPLKYKDPGCPTISVMIGGKVVEKALLDLGVSVNLLSYSVYKQLGLGELKPTSITLSLADRSVKIPREIIEDVLVQVDNFYYPVDFVVLDTDPLVKKANYVSIILGRPFLATSNAIINCRNGLMQLTFGNMTLELNIFHMSKKLITPEEEEGSKEVCIIDTLVDEHCDQNMQDELNESLEDLEEGLSEPADVLATL
ncbi:hypothetical protein CK203_060717 [Vitis vinifera]|uniref:Aspartic peptidase DDI1-type domain-containing protein n=1 Tax=Vitis vinifera TaxID=29760 RepID=A0A438GCE5_VITVI|nr:hypothetical protein CK203_060717 [Vitis vinifera]